MRNDSGPGNARLPLDIAAAQREQGALAESAKYRALFEQCPAGIVVYDASLRVAECNDAVERMFGASRDRLIGLRVDDLRDQRHREALRRALAGETATYESPYQATLTEKWLWIAATFSPVRDASGAITGVIVLIVDRSAEMGVCTSAASGEARLGEAQRLGRVGSWVWDIDRDTAAGSAEFHRIVGTAPSAPLSPAEVLDPLVHPDDRAECRAHVREVLAHQLPFATRELRVVRSDGTERHVIVRAQVSYAGDGRPLSAWGTLQDISERRRLEEQLRRAQRMEALGHLASGVAHDFNNLLTVIRVETDFLEEDIREDDPLQNELREIRRAVERAAGLTRQLLAFSRKQILRPRVLDLNELVRDTSTMLRRLIGEDVELVTTLADNLPPVMADAGQLEQVLVNLAVNARDAMPDGGVLMIETALATPNGDVAAFAAGESITLTVADTGAGIEQGIQPRIFDPFFTTKPAGKGTGLGLSTVLGIVEQSGGHVSVASEPGHGARFTVRLPRAAADVIGHDQPPVSNVRGHEAQRATVLIVEDKETLRTLAQRTLERQGYVVLAAEDGFEALALSESFSGAIDLLLADMVLPGLSGRDVASRLVQGRPGLRVLYMTGFTDDQVFQVGVLDAGVNVLEKPFSAAQLSEAVRRALRVDRSGGPK